MSESKNKKNYIGNGKRVSDEFDLTEVTIDLQDAMATLHTEKGRNKLTFYVGLVEQPDETGKTHAVFYTEEVYEKEKAG